MTQKVRGIEGEEIGTMRAINRKPMKLLALKFDLPLPIIIKLDNKISRG